MELSVGDLQMFYYIAFKASTTKDENGQSPDLESKATEAIEDAMRGEA